MARFALRCTQFHQALPDPFRCSGGSQSITPGTIPNPNLILRKETR
jgi:hypothetical protein